MRSRITRVAMLTAVILALSSPMMALTRDGGNRDQSPIQKVIRIIKRIVSTNEPLISIPKP